MRSKIIDEAITLFSEKGYYNTSLNEIAQKVNIKKASLYYHFKNKDDLYIECLKFIENHFTDIIHNHLSQKSFSYKDYYNFLYSILFKGNIRYVKFVVQLMFVPENLSKTIMKVISQCQKSFQLLLNKYYENNKFSGGYNTFYHSILNISISWIFKASWASNYGILHVVEKNYKENMIEFLKKFMD